jgi:hypothetical protein
VQGEEITEENSLVIPDVQASAENTAVGAVDGGATSDPSESTSDLRQESVFASVPLTRIGSPAGRTPTAHPALPVQAATCPVQCGLVDSPGGQAVTTPPVIGVAKIASARMHADDMRLPPAGLHGSLAPPGSIAPDGSIAQAPGFLPSSSSEQVPALQPDSIAVRPHTRL